MNKTTIIVGAIGLLAVVFLLTRSGQSAPAPVSQGSRYNALATSGPDPAVAQIDSNERVQLAQLRAGLLSNVLQLQSAERVRFAELGYPASTRNTPTMVM